MSRRIDDVELLRGFAVLLVVVHHANGSLFTWLTPWMARFYAYFAGGFGVDLFFAISGFVIARDLVPRLQGAENAASAARITLAFWVRRAWRLWPSAWVWLIAILVACAAFNESGAFGTFRANFEATVVAVLHVANLRFADSYGVYEYGASFPYWSLSLEEQFYLLFPLLVLLSRRWLPYCLGALVLLQFFSSRDLLTMSLRTDAIALGVLIALWSRHTTYALCRPVFLDKPVGPVLLLGAFICMGAISSPELHTVSIHVGLVALLSALLVWVASYDSDFLCPPGYCKRMIIWVGSRSYAIYLIHIPAFLLTREIWFRMVPEGVGFGEKFFWPFVLTSGVIIIILSEINYRLVEMPLRRYGQQVAQRIQCSAVQQARAKVGLPESASQLE
jgi:peptidoglycan/LPS O-acetylase OafA/YrhL